MKIAVAPKSASLLGKALSVLCVATVAALAVPSARAADDPAFTQVSKKTDFLWSRQAVSGTVVTFSVADVDAWVRVRIPARYPGIRKPKVVLGMDRATGSATIDFAKVMEAQGKPLGAAAALMAGGEHPVLVAVNIVSSGGKATVTPTRVEISGVAATGSVLDFMIKTFLLPLFPDAEIGKPFELGLDMGRLEVRPNGVRVTIKK